MGRVGWGDKGREGASGGVGKEDHKEVEHDLSHLINATDRQDCMQHPSSPFPSTMTPASSPHNYVNVLVTSPALCPPSLPPPLPPGVTVNGRPREQLHSNPSQHFSAERDSKKRSVCHQRSSHFTQPRHATSGEPLPLPDPKPQYSQPDADSLDQFFVDQKAVGNI